MGCGAVTMTGLMPDNSEASVTCRVQAFMQSSTFSSNFAPSSASSWATAL
jgi:hypothetical protein